MRLLVLTVRLQGQDEPRDRGARRRGEHDEALDGLGEILSLRQMEPVAAGDVNATAVGRRDRAILLTLRDGSVRSSRRRVLATARMRPGASLAGGAFGAIPTCSPSRSGFP